jgi:hypothetical protein
VIDAVMNVVFWFFALSGAVGWLLVIALSWYYHACMPQDSLLRPRR